ncbi:IclR family transcriptional regulator [Salinigranum rubrum]|uniref:IclR family transcriptional regulator n=1 Tax=Salinigranum rubrum TaxID=755307 RepID=A0A2I8VNX8_9EURY|nr:IclR family transcriptional regulator [Salinigranum rubrum]AUV83584.1 IclR family transcriptional regulator [Salinigranum rubrum]
MDDVTGDETAGRRLKSVSRAFRIIEHLRTEDEATLSEIAAAFDVPVSTAHIYMATLVASGYVIKEDGNYRCSLRFLRTGGELRDRMALFKAAKNEVDNLQQEHGEIANVGTMENGYMVQLYKSENPDSIDDNAPLGTHLYLHRTATGKSMLAQLPEADVDRIVDLRGLPQSTAATIKTREELNRELDRIRERKYAINNGEHFPGVRAVAVPIMLDTDSVVGAISISGPLSRMSEERINEELAPALFDKRNIIELKLVQR